MLRVVRELWLNENGSANWWTEGNDGRRESFRIGGTADNPIVYPVSAVPGASPRGYDDTTYGGFATVTATADGTTGGGTSLRKDMLFDIPTLGFDELYIDWAGEQSLDNIGFGVDAIPNAPLANTRRFFADDIFASAQGVPYSHPQRGYSQWAPAHRFSTLQEGLLQPMGNGVAGAGSQNEAALWANGKRLWVLGTGQSFVGFAAPRGTLMGGRMSALTPGYLDTSGAVIAKGGFVWGYVAYDGAGVPIPAPPANGVGSRFNLRGDTFGFTIQIGWPRGVAPLDITAGATVVPVVGGLSVAAFERVRCNVMSIGNCGANVTFLPTGQNFQLIRGCLSAILINHSSPEDKTIFISRDGKITEMDHTTFQTQGDRRG